MRIRLTVWFSLIALLAMTYSGLTRAHEITPTIIEMEPLQGNQIEMRVDANLEALMIDMGSDHEDTDESPKAAQYNALRSLDENALALQASAFVKELISRMTLMDQQGQPVALVIESQHVTVNPQPDLDLARQSLISYQLNLGEAQGLFTFKWAEGLGNVVVRITNEGSATGALWVAEGTVSEPFDLLAGTLEEQSFIDYIIIGFEHILPLGLDHILFVLGLYLLSQRFKDLLWQVSAFTLAHTVTLALAVLGYVNLPGSIVEPLIALSIVYVAVENLYRKQVSRSRVVLVFGFGLLHGLGFAGVLSEIGLSSTAFVPSLIAFNIGVELGQLAVILGTYFLVGRWFGNKPYWNTVFRIPASLFIALIGAYWFIERTFVLG